VESEEALQRLDPTAHRARKEESGASEGAEVVAALAPAGVEPLAAPDALGECLKPALEDRLAATIPGETGAPVPRDVRYAVIARAARSVSRSP